MSRLYKTARGVFEIHECYWGWGVLNLTNGHVEECASEAECHALLRSHGPAEPGQRFDVFGVFPERDRDHGGE